MKTFSIPKHWTPQQALAYLDLLEELHRAIWEIYESQLVDLIIADLTAPEPTVDQCHTPEPNDDIPW